MPRKSFGLVAFPSPTLKAARHKPPWSCFVAKKSLAPAFLLAFLAAVALAASVWFSPGHAANGEECPPGKTCSSGKVYDKQTLMRMSCQALEDLEDSILSPEASSLDPIRSFEALDEVDRRNIALIHAVERLKNCAR
jgi:hypothetical protein